MTEKASCTVISLFSLGHVYWVMGSGVAERMKAMV